MKRIKLVFLITLKITMILLITVIIFKHLNKTYRNLEVNYGDDFKAMPTNSIDVLFLGSSHAQYSTIPSFINRKTGLVSFNMSSQCQPIPVSLEFLKEALKTQKPKLVVQEIFIALPGRETCRADSNYIVGQYYLTGQEKQNVLNMIDQEKALQYRQDFLNNHNNWKKVKTFKELYMPIKTQLSDSFGYVYADTMYYENYWNAEIYPETQDYELDKLDLKALSEMKELCDKNNIELMFYHVPMAMSQEDQNAKESLWDWADKNNVKYLDFFDDNYHQNFNIMVHGDTHHNNILGASYVSDQLSKFIQNNYDLSVNHSINQELNSLYLKNSDILLKEVIDKELNPDLIFESVKDFNSLVLVKYVSNNQYLNDKSIDSLKKINIEFNSQEDYFAVIKDKKVVAYDTSELKIKIDNKEITINKEGIFVDGESKNISSEYFLNQEIKTEGNFTMVFYSENYNWEIIKNFDINVNGELWTKGFNKYVKEGYW